MTDNMPDIDWRHYFDLFADGGTDVDDDILDEYCKTAFEIASLAVPSLINRLNAGKISQRIIGYVVINMVMRKLRYGLPVKESNGIYSYTTGEPSDSVDASVRVYGRSPNLYLSKHEKQLLEGTASATGGILGNIHMNMSPDRFA